MGWKVYEMVMDIKRGNQSNQLIQIVTEDYGTNTLKIKLITGENVAYNLTGKDVRMVVKTPSNARIQQDCIIENPLSGTVSITLQQSLILEKGSYIAELQIYDAGSSIVRLTTPNFRYHVRQSLQTDDSVKADNNYTMLQEMISRAENVIAIVELIDTDEVLTTIAQLESLKADLTIQLGKLKDYGLLESQFIALQAEFTQLVLDVDTAIVDLQLELTNHKNSRMPHKAKDLKANKEYTFGLQVSADGNPQIIYEEVM